MKTPCHDLEGIVDERLIATFNTMPNTTKIHMVTGDRDVGIETFQAFQQNKPEHLSIETHFLLETSHGFVTPASLEGLMQRMSQFLRPFVS